MIEASLDSLVAISPEGKITDANQATVKVTGVAREELIGTSFSDYFTEPDKANKIYRLVFAEGTAVDYPLTIRHTHGTATEALYNASVYRDANGRYLASSPPPATSPNRSRARGTLPSNKPKDESG